MSIGKVEVLATNELTNRVSDKEIQGNLNAFISERKTEGFYKLEKPFTHSEYRTLCESMFIQHDKTENKIVMCLDIER